MTKDNACRIVSRVRGRTARRVLGVVLAATGTLAAVTTARAQWLPLTVNQSGPVASSSTYSLDWTPDPSCSTCLAYDVIQGDLYVLRAAGTAGDFTSATTACLGNNVPAPPVSPLPVPGVGQGYFFLVRAQQDPISAPCYSWNSDWLIAPDRQCGDRDSEINAASSVCPCP